MIEINLERHFPRDRERVDSTTALSADTTGLDTAEWRILRLLYSHNGLTLADIVSPAGSAWLAHMVAHQAAIRLVLRGSPQLVASFGGRLYITREGRQYFETHDGK